MHIYADWEITCTLSKMHTSGPGRETSLQLMEQGTSTGTHRRHWPACGDPHAFPLPTQPPLQQHHSHAVMGRGGKRPCLASASATVARDAGSDGNEAQAASRAQPGLNLICSLRGTCSISQIQGNSHKTQVICCNIVVGSYSRFAEIGDVLGVLGLPQSTAGRRYEISIYILQPGQGSDNLMAKLRGEQSSLGSPAGAEGAGRVPWSPGTWWPSTGCSRVPRSTQPEKLLPTHPFCGLAT